MNFKNKFNQQVQKAKTLLVKYEKYSKQAIQVRNEIADIAIEVRQLGKIVEFSKQLGMKNSTLNHWMQEREKELGLNNAVPVKATPTPAEKQARKRTKAKINRKTPKKEIQQIYKSELKKSSEDLALEVHIKALDALKFDVCSQFVLAKCDADLLDKIRMYCDDISEKITVAKAVSNTPKVFNQKELQ